MLIPVFYKAYIIILIAIDVVFDYKTYSITKHNGYYYGIVMVIVVVIVMVIQRIKLGIDLYSAVIVMVIVVVIQRIELGIDLYSAVIVVVVVKIETKPV